MSTALQPAKTPKPGDRVRAIVSTDPTDPTKNHRGWITLEDGSLVLSKDDLAVMGNGNPRVGAQEIRRMIAIERDRKVSEGNTERPTSVRIADQADEAAILDLLMMDVRDNAAMVALPDADRILEQVRVGTERRGGIVGVIDGADGKPVAVCVLVPIQWWWSQHFCFQELVLYVHPDHRKSNHFRDLVKFQRWWVEQMSKLYGYRVYLLCGVLGVHRVREKIMAYRRWFRLAGAAFVYPAPFAGDVR